MTGRQILETVRSAVRPPRSTAGTRPPSGADAVRPAWVILGTPVGNGQVAVYASKDLNDAVLTRELDEELGWGLDARSPHWLPGPQRIELTVGMRTYTVVVADTYQQALRTLFDTWSPDPARPALPPT